MSEFIKAKMRAESRYPYTYASDYLRECVGDDYGKGLISRSAASHIRTVIAEIIDINDKDLAELIAEKYIDKYWQSTIPNNWSEQDGRN